MASNAEIDAACAKLAIFFAGKDKAPQSDFAKLVDYADILSRQNGLMIILLREIAKRLPEAKG